MIKHAAFILALLVQLGIVLYPSAEKMVLRSDPENVIQLRTKPVDPYDMMREYYMTLRFEISEPPGFEYDEDKAGETVYTVLEQEDEGIWNAISAAEDPPILKQNQRVIKGWISTSSREGPILYGIEKYYVPEEMGGKIEEAVRAEKEKIVVDVAVDDQGRSAILRIHAGDQVYEY